jgi:hypothetical protein
MSAVAHRLARLCVEKKSTHPRLEELEARCLLSTNLAPNPYAIGPGCWTLSYGAAYTTAVSHDSNPSSGAWNISTPNAHIRSSLIAVTPGQEYTYSAFLQETAFPAFGEMYVAVYDAAKHFKYDVEGSYEAPTAANQWQETAIQYQAQPGDGYVILNYKRLPTGIGPRDDGSMWVDDISFTAGTSFRQPAPTQQAFAGSMVQVDAQGNFQVLQNGTWQPFFAFAVYRGGAANTVQNYSNQGFNVLESNQFDLNLLQQAKNAVSSFNPNGMMSVIDIEQYIDPRFSLYGNLADLKANLIALENSPLIDRVLCFYWDNERYTNYSMAQSVISLVKQYDVDANGVRRHPILMNNANQGTDRAYTGMVDIVGDYIRDPETASYLGPSQSIGERATITRNIEGQTAPFTIGVISEEAYAVNVRRLVYETLIAGGHGIAYYRDGAHFLYNGDPNSPAANNIALRDCWPEFPILRSEIDQLMPLLETPVAVTWSAGASSSSAVIGLRTYNGEGYLMLVNPTGSSLTITFTPSGLGYSPASVIDFFSGATITAISGGSFTITLAANQTAVYQLAQPAAAATVAISAAAAPLPLSPTAKSDNYIANSGFIAPTTNTASHSQLSSASAPPKSTSSVYRRARRKAKGWTTTLAESDFIMATNSLPD